MITSARTSTFTTKGLIKMVGFVIVFKICVIMRHQTQNQTRIQLVVHLHPLHVKPHVLLLVAKSETCFLIYKPLSSNDCYYSRTLC